MWPCCLVMGAGTGARKAPGGLCSPRTPTSLLLGCAQESGGENLAGREKAWENHQASSLGAGGHVCTGGRLGPAEKQPQTVHWKVRQDAGKDGHRPRSQGDVQCTHTHVHSRVRTHIHTGALTCSHTPTHTRIHAHSALTFILHAPPLTLTYTRVLTSESWLRF